jgi:hypothetical protein
MSKQTQQGPSEEAVKEALRQVERELTSPQMARAIGGPLTLMHERIMAVFEGHCPECGSSVALRAASGTHQFFVDQEWAKGAAEQIRTWPKGRGALDRVIGALEYCCQSQGHMTTVDYSKGGDWNA